MIEVRAERAFDFYKRVTQSAETSIDKPKEGAHGVDLINRIRLDESVHVAWLRAAISEFRSFKMKAVGGSEISGAEILDPVWEKMVHWRVVAMHDTKRPLNIATLKETVLALKDGQSLFKQFEALVT
jgi:hypothetical protein